MSAVTFPGARTLGALVAVFFAAVPRLSRGAALDTTAFAWRMPVTVSGYEGASALTDFPVLVTLSAGSPAGFNYSLCAADGSDLRFADGAGALIPHEIETWDAAGTSFVWVKVPTLSGKATALTGYFGTNGVDALPSVAATDVWTRYAAVFHGGATIADATGKAAAVTPQTVSGAASGGKAGGAMTKSSGLGFTFTNPVISGALSTIGSFSFSGWFKKSGGTTAVLLSNKGRNEWQQNGFVALVEQGTYFSVGSKGHQGTSGKGALAVGTWGHLAFSYDKSATKLDSYFDGESIHSTSSALAIVDPGKAVWSFGGFFDSPDNAFQGSMDELRILNGTASADWIKAERDSVADPASFAVLSPVESTAAGVPVIASASFEETTPDSVWTLAATLGANDAALTLVLSADGRADVEIPAGDATEGVAVTKAVSPAIDDIDTTVLWRVKLVAANASGSAEWTFPGAVDFAPTATTRGDFAKKFAVTVPAGFADESLASFPLLVRLSAANIPGFDYGDFRRDGADLRVEDEAGNPLPHELETWNAGGESLLWVSAPAVAEGTHLTVYYGAARRCPVPAGMWSGYAGVWHLDEAGDGAVTVADATANALDGMANELSVAQAQGVLGGARGVDKNKAFPLVLVPAANASALALAPTFTASGWLRPWTTESSYRYILSRRYNDKTSAWGLQFRGGTSGNVGTIAVYSNGAVDNDDNRVLFNTRDAFAANKWTKYAVVYTETTATLYLDGALAATGALKPGAPADGALPFSIGGVSRETDASLNADHDEVRLR
ncbi:MAG: DUF2341 domain-containing protein, partial [Kiritimatiellae bacterium]|nr:DUF2341 domain-containing protein [Kiritimatiellia bacterium]